MTIAILSTGDELILGDTLNTNAHAIAHSLSSEGLSVGLHLACSDRESEMVACLNFLSAEHDTIIITGGLGPTSDDRTRFALAHFLNCDLVEHANAVAHVRTRLMRAQLNENPGHLQQTLFPHDAQLLPNAHGTAMGAYLVVDHKRFVLLPGPPRECLPMFNEHVLSNLQRDLKPSDSILLKWLLFGVAEGEVSRTLDAALLGVDCEIGYRLDTPYVEFKVRCHPQTEAEVRAIIDPLVAPFIIASFGQKASECLRLKIDQLNVSIAIIDDVTGGVLQRLLQRPSNYRQLIFHAQDESCDITFNVTGLDEYWQQLPSAITNVQIACLAGDKKSIDTHQLPYRSPLVVEYAAEWLCFRLLHLINQLHEGVA